MEFKMPDLSNENISVTHAQASDELTGGKNLLKCRRCGHTDRLIRVKDGLCEECFQGDQE